MKRINRVLWLGVAVGAAVSAIWTQQLPDIGWA